MTWLNNLWERRMVYVCERWSCWTKKILILLLSLLLLRWLLTVFVIYEWGYHPYILCDYRLSDLYYFLPMLSFYIIIVIVKNKILSTKVSTVAIIIVIITIIIAIAIITNSNFIKIIYPLSLFFIFFIVTVIFIVISFIIITLLAFYVIFRPWQDSRVHPKFVRFTSSTFSSLRFRLPYSSLSSPHPLCFPFPLPILFLYLTFFPPLPFPSSPYSPSPSLSPFPFHLAWPQQQPASQPVSEPLP